MVRLTEWVEHPIFGREQPTLIDRWLFHYTTIDRAASIALLGALSLSPLNVLNDPRESRERQVATMTSSFARGDRPQPPRTVPSEERLAYERQIADLRAGIRVACFTRDASDGENGTAIRADSRGYARPRMWAQYGANHRGICLTLDRSTLVARAEREFGENVVAEDLVYSAGYDDVAEAASVADFDNPDPVHHFDSRFVPSLLRKNADWQGEREFRIVVRSDKPSTLLPIDGSIVGLVLGVDFDDHRLPTARAIAERFNVDDMSAGLYLTNGVLTPYPVRDVHGRWRRWSENDLGWRGTIFEEEDARWGVLHGQGHQSAEPRRCRSPTRSLAPCWESPDACVPQAPAIPHKLAIPHVVVRYSASMRYT